MDTVQKVVVVPQEPIATINPLLHGQFAEHLGELVYSGVWVGTDSSIPNTGGIRNDVIEALKPLNIPVLRWPGGCFADNYHWRDGIGPRENRPLRVNTHWGMAPEPNQFGTHEFMAFCRAIGAEPYFAGNIGSATPGELRDWVEYTNFGGKSSLADERRANGSDEPFGIKYWGIGNENWGCGGNMTPEEYTANFSRYSTFVFDYPGVKIEKIACGPNGHDWAWTRRFFESMLKHSSWSRLPRAQGFAAHYYCGTAGTATEYSEDQWFELLAKAYSMEGIITGHRAIMNEFDPEHKINLFMDEWGAWHPEEIGKPAGGLYQQNTIRDALVAALTLDVFHNQADKVFMANIAQVINVLQTLLLVQGDKFIKTPTYHVFDLYQAHRGGQAVRFDSEAEIISDGGAAKSVCQENYIDNKFSGLKLIHGSASVKEGRLCVTVVNTHPTQVIELDLAIQAATLDEIELVRLAANDIHAHNTFENPDTVRLSSPEYNLKTGGNLRVQLPPASITRLTGKLV